MSYSWRSPQCANSEVTSPSWLHPILTQFNSIDTITPHFSEIHSITGLPSTTRAPEWSSWEIFFQKFCMYFSNLPCLQKASPSYPPPLASVPSQYSMENTKIRGSKTCLKFWTFPATLGYKSTTLREMDLSPSSDGTGKGKNLFCWSTNWHKLFLMGPKK